MSSTYIPGNQSDIGGSYAQGAQGKQNDIQFYILNWIVNQANQNIPSLNSRQNIFNALSSNQQPSANLSDLMNFYFESKQNNTQSYIDAAKSFLNQGYIYNEGFGIKTPWNYNISDQVTFNSLNKTQINNLQKDIIWFETQTINNITYITPKIYLSKTTRDNLKNNDATSNNSLIFANNNINITSTGSVINQGSIIANNNINILAKDEIINKNFSNIIAFNNLSMTSTDSSITNFSKIKANNTINLTAAKDITNTATILTNDSNLLASNNNGVSSYITNGAEESNKNNKNISSEILETASIKGGSVSINAGNNFNNFAANIDTSKNIINQSAIDQAKAHNKKVIETGIGEVIAIPSPIYSSGNLTLTADNDINISTLALRNRTETTWGNRKKGGTDIVDITTNIGSNINIDGSLTATTTGLGLASEQKEIDALNAKIQAKYDEDMLAYNIALEKYQKSLTYIPILKESISPQSPPTKPEDPIFYKQATSNINIIGSNITTKEDLNLAAKDNVNIISAQDSSYKYVETHKKGLTVQKSSNDITQDITNVSSNLVSTNGNININSGSDTNIIASNLSGTNGNIIVGKYIDNNPLSATYGQEIINDDAKLTIKSGQDYHYKYHEETKIKTDSTAVAVGAAAAVAVTVATGGTGAVVIAGAAASGAATGAQGKKGKTTISETTEITQKQSNLNFSNDLNIQSASNTTITASNVTADSATILTGKFRNGGFDTIINSDAKLNINSAFNSTKTDSSTQRVKPNYVGIAAVSAASAFAGFQAEKAAFDTTILATNSDLLANLAGSAAGFAGSKAISAPASQLDSLFNIRSKKTHTEYRETIINTDLNFNNLITE